MRSPTDIDQHTGLDHYDGQRLSCADGKIAPRRMSKTEKILDGVRLRIREVLKERGRHATSVAKEAGLGKSQLTNFLSHESGDINLGSVLAIAAELGTTVADLVPDPKTVRDNGIDPNLDLVISSHGSPAFRPAAEAFLVLHTHSVAAAATVRTVALAGFDRAYPWTSTEWFEELMRYHRARLRGLRMPPP